jgi:hypothetical protein
MRDTHAGLGRWHGGPGKIEHEAGQRPEKAHARVRTLVVPTKDLKLRDGPLEREQEEVVAGMRQGWGVRP